MRSKSFFVSVQKSFLKGWNLRKTTRMFSNTLQQQSLGGAETWGILKLLCKRATNDDDDVMAGIKMTPPSRRTHASHYRERGRDGTTAATAYDSLIWMFLCSSLSAQTEVKFFCSSLMLNAQSTRTDQRHFVKRRHFDLGFFSTRRHMKCK